MGCSSSRPDSDGYVINGFYMSMREKFVADGASITYMMVQWDEKDLSWEDFRGKVLGSTDPTTAAKGSLRATILETYEALDLKSVPNTGDNGVHASASPFEGMCERLNWAEVKLEDDAFGKALLDLKIDSKTVMGWTKDPQVEVEGKMTSLFDTMEDINASDCLAKAKAIAKSEGDVGSVKNMAFVFVKPHANNEKVVKLVKDKFAEVKIEIVKEGKIEGSVIDKKLLIDNHYYSIANKAKLTAPKDLSVPEKGLKKFEDTFGLTWEAALKGGMVMNAAEAAKKYKLDSSELNERWAKAKDDGLCIKFGGGFYCAKVFAKVVAKSDAPEKAPEAEEKKDEAAAEAAPAKDEAAAEAAPAEEKKDEAAAAPVAAEEKKEEAKPEAEPAAEQPAEAPATEEAKKEDA